MTADWSDPAPDRPIPLLAAWLDDLRAHVPEGSRGGPRAARAARLLKVAATTPGVHLASAYRLGHAARGRLGLPGRAIGAALFWAGRHLYGCSIAPTARLYGGLVMPHPQGIVVGGGVVVGPRAWIFQNVTIGGTPGREGLPRVGADARIYPGAVIAGPVAIGDGCVVGANAVVVRDLPPRTLARAPAPSLAEIDRPADGREGRTPEGATHP